MHIVLKCLAGGGIEGQGVEHHHYAVLAQRVEAGGAGGTDVVGEAFAVGEFVKELQGLAVELDVRRFGRGIVDEEGAEADAAASIVSRVGGTVVVHENAADGVA